MVYTDDQWLGLASALIVMGALRAVMVSIKAARNTDGQYQLIFGAIGRSTHTIVGGGMMIGAHQEGISPDGTTYFRMAMVILAFSGLWEIGQCAGSFFKQYDKKERLIGTITGVIMIIMEAAVLLIEWKDPITVFPDTKMSQTEVALLTTAGFAAALGVVESMSCIIDYRAMDPIGVAHQSFSVIMCFALFVPVFVRIAESDLDIVMYYLSSLFIAFDLIQAILTFLMKVGNGSSMRARGTSSHYGRSKGQGTASRYGHHGTANHWEKVDTKEPF